MRLDADMSTQKALLDTLKQRQPQIALDANTVCFKSLTASTNDDASALAAAGYATGLCVARAQSAGRGQSGRVWQSPTGNVYLSLLWRLTRPLSGALALEVALALMAMPLLSGIAGIGIKWPNDLHHLKDNGYAKWGGILIEPLGTHQVIIGVGINVDHAQINAVQDQPISSLSSILGHDVDLLSITADATIEMIAACRTFDAGSPALATRFARVDTLAQQPVSVQHPNQPALIGIAQGISADGALLLEVNGVQQVLYSGQVRRVVT